MIGTLATAGLALLAALSLAQRGGASACPYVGRPVAHCPVEVQAQPGIPAPSSARGEPRRNPKN